MKSAIDHRIDLFRELIERGVYYRIMNFNLDLLKRHGPKEVRKYATLGEMDWTFCFYTG